MHSVETQPQTSDRPHAADRLRVAFVIGSLGGGGSERQLLQLLGAIDRRRFEPLLYLLDRTGSLLPEIPADVPVFAFTDHYSQTRSIIPGRMHRLQVQQLARFLDQQRIQVVYDRTWISTLVAGPAAERASVPRVSVVVVDPVQDLQRREVRFRRVKQRILRRVYRTAARVLTVSQDLRDLVMETYALPGEQVRTVRNPVDIDRIDRLAHVDVPGWEPDRFHIVSAGRLEPQKGYAYLIDAVGRLVRDGGCERILLHILGIGSHEAQLRAQVDERGLANHVRFEGFQENPYGFYRKADLFCLASIYEGMPNVLLEALTCRTPVLSTDCPTGPREILDGGRFGRLVPPKHVEALADGIRDVMQNPTSGVTKAAAARTDIERTFSLTARIGELEEILGEVAAVRPGNRSDFPG